MIERKIRHARSHAAPAIVRSSARPGVLYTGVVLAADGVRFAAVTASRVELVRRLADYVRQQSGHALWPHHTRYLRALLARGELEAAVEVYFGLVGERWDEEWLVTTVVEAGSRSRVAHARRQPGRLLAAAQHIRKDDLSREVFREGAREVTEVLAVGAEAVTRRSDSSK